MCPSCFETAVQGEKEGKGDVRKGDVRKGDVRKGDVRKGDVHDK
jgi:hypothetical protein